MFIVSRWRRTYQIRPGQPSWQDIVRGERENLFHFIFWWIHSCQKTVCICMQWFFLTGWQMFVEKSNPVEFKMCQLNLKLISDLLWQHIHHWAADKMKRTQSLFLFDRNLFDNPSTGFHTGLMMHCTHFKRRSSMSMFVFSLQMHAGRVVNWRLLGWSPDETFQIQTNKQPFFVLARATPSVPQSALRRLSSKPHQTEVIHVHIMNKHKATEAKTHVHTNTRLCFSSFYAEK